MYQASTSDSKKRLALAIIDFLATSLKDGTLLSEDAESIEVAQSCIADTFHVNPSDKKAMQEALGGQSLLSIYGVYEKLKGKTTSGASGASGAKDARPITTEAEAGSKGVSNAPTPEAEVLKSRGNTAMAKKDYKTAIDLYSQAIALVPLNPIYLSNRAAAYSALNRHSEAQTDAEMAVAADPKYTKAWSRLGLARYVQGDAKGSMEAYAKGIEYEGNGGSEAMKKGYETAKKRVEQDEKDAIADDESEDVESTRSAGGGGVGGMPDLSALAGMLGGGGRGGGPDLSSIMSNPMFASMAQNMMSNPDMMSNLMNNPKLKQMAESFGLGGGAGGSGGEGAGAGAGESRGGGAGGLPDLASMMQDPNIAEM